MFVVETGIGQVVEWRDGFVPSSSVDLLTEWARLRGRVSLTPTGPDVLAYPLPIEETLALLLVGVWAVEIAGGVANMIPPEGFDPYFGGPPDALY